eukprot:CAMPEP_0181225154 /NCGR_PEP_ID=MMETSP1096-20121128/31530_1 /TAXON_ID=156174 ORGANISM="Chrysochromulina ericina, Strain CCMP281" /NCGR_SAMPLE_ID=MMETSP1096 /ASSEMBLY_ACC=CAM_ASM_000453 /LENGTH=33 /DNA_ID= /DNA_START= /DNA_END= /DNA_ORIENTATION=
MTVSPPNTSLLMRYGGHTPHHTTPGAGHAPEDS